MSAPVLPVLPVFPLPNVLLYPGAILPLHIFEPRYVQMIEDLALVDDPQLALALLQPGWDKEYFEQPRFFPLAGVGRLVSVQSAPDGRFNILIEGISRARLLEQETDKSYRVASVEFLHEEMPEDEQLPELRTQLRQALEQWSEEEVQTDPARGIGYLADVLLLTLGIPIGEKQALFELLDPVQRAQAALRHFHAAQQLSARLDDARGTSGDQASLN